MCVLGSYFLARKKCFLFFVILLLCHQKGQRWDGGGDDDADYYFVVGGGVSQVDGERHREHSSERKKTGTDGVVVSSFQRRK